MALFILLVLATAFLAYANGANDNFKGVATLFGSDTVAYRGALLWATATTFLGSAASIFLAKTLVARFSGKGLVPDAVAASPEFLLAVALGAGLTVLLATLTGFPISTTHSLTGALVGSGLLAVGTELNVTLLGQAYFVPLLASPLLAAVLAVAAVGTGRGLHGAVRLVRASERAPRDPEPPAVFFRSGLWPLPDPPAWFSRGGGAGLLDAAHYASAGIVSFARGLNDTPKIVALLLAVEGLKLPYGMLIVACAMAAGGWLNARKVARTMSKRITPLTPGKGFTANVVTGVLVVVASRLGMPVSTTHVSVGSIFGIGVVTGEANRRVVSGILLSWVLTLPAAAIASAAAYFVLNGL